MHPVRRWRIQQSNGSQLLTDIIRDPDDVTRWEKLFYFSSIGFTRPSRGGKSRNLTTLVVKQMREYDSGHIATNVKSRESRSTKTLTDEMIAKTASAKLEDGDIRGAIRLLSSADSIVPPDEDTFKKLVELDPARHTDRRPPPSSTGQSMQTSPLFVRAGVASFPNGSAGGPNGLRPQHIKDLVPESNSNQSLLENITEFVNIILQWKTPLHVRPILLGGSLTALRNVGGGLRPIAVGYYWRHFVVKVACRQDCLD